MQDTILNKLYDYIEHRASVDRYGQLGIITLGSFLTTDEEKDEAKKILPISCYGGRLGTYYGFNVANLPTEIQTKCYEAKKRNEGYKRAMTSL